MSDEVDIHKQIIWAIFWVHETHHTFWSWKGLWSSGKYDRASFWGGGANEHLPPPFARISPLLGTCEHCMRCESKTSDAPHPPKLFNRQLSPPLDNLITKWTLTLGDPLCVVWTYQCPFICGSMSVLLLVIACWVLNEKFPGLFGTDPMYTEVM